MYECTGDGACGSILTRIVTAKKELIKAANLHHHEKIIRVRTALKTRVQTL